MEHVLCITMVCLLFSSWNVNFYLHSFKFSCSDHLITSTEMNINLPNRDSLAIISRLESRRLSGFGQVGGGREEEEEEKEIAC